MGIIGAVFGIIFAILVVVAVLALVGAIVLPIAGIALAFGLVLAIIGLAFKIVFSKPMLILIAILAIIYACKKH